MSMGAFLMLPKKPVEMAVQRKKIVDKLKSQKIRVEIDERNEKLGYKIREARLDKVPYMIILGEKEQEHKTVSVRQRDAQADHQDMGEMPLEMFMELVQGER